MKAARLAVLGAGESGVGAAILAKKKGIDVLVSDAGKIKEEYRNVLYKFEIPFEENGHSQDVILQAKEVVKSPGIPDKVPLVVQLRELGVPVISEIEFAGRYTNAKMLCITGSNGKTTTAMLLYHILKKAGLNVGLAGNVGKSLAWQVAEEEFDHYVVELSSFQLDGMSEFKVDIAVLLNITPDHLDRYDHVFQNYVDSKFRITNNQGPEDVFIYCIDDPGIMEALPQKEINATQYPFSIMKIVEEGAYIEKEDLVITINNKLLKMSIQELALQGRHNIYNSMAAGIAARVLEIRKDLVRECFADFQNIEHRLEFVATVCGIRFINDSKATNVNSTWYALETVKEPVIWIVGGVDKGNDYSGLKGMVKEKVKAIICLGEDNEKIHKAFSFMGDKMVNASSMMEAVGIAYQLGQKDDTVLLSPACASFDLFTNYEDRGYKFKEAVRSL